MYDQETQAANVSAIYNLQFKFAHVFATTHPMADYMQSFDWLVF